jgi:hypothetical protein
VRVIRLRIFSRAYGDTYYFQGAVLIVDLFTFEQKHGAFEMAILRKRTTMNFVLVNDRTPRASSVCAHCSTPIGLGYLRGVSTQLPYCDHECYVRYSEKAAPLAGADIDNLRIPLMGAGIDSLPIVRF